MVGPTISFVATLGLITIGQNGLSSLWLYGQIFWTLFKFLVKKIFLVPLVYVYDNANVHNKQPFLGIVIWIIPFLFF
jgi:hypothetical protein